MTEKLDESDNLITDVSDLDGETKDKDSNHKIEKIYKSKLSLNSEAKSMDRFKDEAGRNDITSYFKRAVLRSKERNFEDKRSLLEKNLSRKKEHVEINKSEMERKNVDNNLARNNEVKNKFKNKLKQTKDSVLENNKTNTQIIFTENSRQTLNTNGSSSQMEEAEVYSTDQNNLSDRKVRFSNNVEEYSPEQIKHQIKIIEVTSVEVAANHELQVKDVFKFMMDRRNRSIGQNLEGKELEKSAVDEKTEQERKCELSARKAKFQNCADIKGRKEKTRQEQEKQVVIKKILNKRAKRFKKMLIQKDQNINLNSVEINNAKEKREIDYQKYDVKTEWKRKSENQDESLDDNIIVKRKKPKLLINSDSEHQDLVNKQDLIAPCETGASSFVEILNLDNHLNSCSKLQLKTNRKAGNCKRSKLTLKKNACKTNDDILDCNTGVCSNLNESNASIELDDSCNDESTLVHSKENCNVQHILANRLKKWKMKIRINVEDETDQETQRLLISTNNTNKTVYEGSVESVLNIDSDSSNESLSLSSIKINKHDINALDNPKSQRLAPIFIPIKKKSKKPQLNQAIIEARKKFLHSEIPSKFQKRLKKQKLMEAEFQTFPTVSHITITPTNDELKNSSINFWNLPDADLEFKKNEPFLPCYDSSSLYTSSTFSISSTEEFCTFEKIDSIKRYLKHIKNDNCHYPVYKVFNSLYEMANMKLKTNINEIKHVKKRKLKKKKSKFVIKDRENNLGNDSLLSRFKQEMWTELYKPSSATEILGNNTAVAYLKSWLETWMDLCEDINRQRSNYQQRGSDSGSDFEDLDGNSRDSSEVPGNALVLCGPHGCGKTMTIYALCNELGINIIELNASSKRTGKHLLQQFQEATQSHQVRKDSSSILTLIEDTDSKSANDGSQNSNSQSSQSRKKMCLLLIEDVDIVYDQDDSFINALNQLLVTSKRPLILTTTDPNCLHLKKISSNNKIIYFNPLSARMLAVWLQIVCLIEGVYMSRDMIAELLERRNKGDIRRTLLLLQFWVGSRVQSKLEKSNTKSIYENSENVIEEGVFCKDDTSLSWLNGENIDEVDFEKAMHSHCLDGFGYSKTYNELYSSFPLDLGSEWWNVSNMLKVIFPSSLKRRNESNDQLHRNETNTTYFTDLEKVANVLEGFSIADIIYNKLEINCNNEPVHKNRGSTISNSLELNECVEDYSFTKQFSHGLCNYLIGSYMISPKESRTFTEEKRWQNTQYQCQEVLQRVVPPLCRLDHHSVKVDYLPTMRKIARSEAVRARTNNKRRSRFFNYLCGLGINCNESLLNTACEAFD